MGLAMVRIGYRMLYEHMRGRISGSMHETRRALVMGAGDAAKLLIAGIQHHGWVVVGLLLITKRQDFIMRMLWVATWWFLKYLREIDSRVNSAEKELRKSVRNRDLMILMRLQKTLVFFNTSIHGNEALIEHLRRSYADDCDADLLEDLEIEMKQADNTVGVYSDILSGTMDAYASIISNNVNEIMKRMTSITIILMIPTLIASFYGMNVDGLWLASVRGSFFIVVGIAVVLTVATYIVLRKIKWF